MIKKISLDHRVDYARLQLVSSIEVEVYLDSKLCNVKSMSKFESFCTYFNTSTMFVGDS